MSRRARSQVRFELRSRLVETPDYPWLPLADSFSDRGVAEDFLRTLRSDYGPAVVRVEAVGGPTGAADERVLGDWLCGDGGALNGRLSPRPWRYEPDAQQWAAEAGGPLEAWEDCRDGRWMAHAAASLGVDRRLVVLAACACARSVAHLATGNARGVGSCLAVTERWAKGEAAAEDVRDVAYDVAYAGEGADDGEVLDAALSAAYAAYSTARLVARTAAAAVAHAELAAYQSDPDSDDSSLAMAGLVREAIPTLAFLRVHLKRPSRR